MKSERIDTESAITVTTPDAILLISLSIILVERISSIHCQSMIALIFCTPLSVFTHPGVTPEEATPPPPASLRKHTCAFSLSLPVLRRFRTVRRRPPRRYAGDLREGVRHGKGILKLRNGGEYDGQWVNGRMHGFGVYIWPDAQIYKGEWVAGLRQGEGTVSLPSGERSAAV